MPAPGEPTPSVTLPPPPKAPGETLMLSLDTASQLIDFCAGYRARAITAGFLPDAAEQMAVQLHGSIVARTKGRQVT